MVSTHTHTQPEIHAAQKYLFACLLTQIYRLVGECF